MLEKIFAFFFSLSCCGMNNAICRTACTPWSPE
jgi:hypothetical protein